MTLEHDATIDDALKRGYRLYLDRVDYRDKLMPDDPERRYAQACVEAAGEMYFLIRNSLKPLELSASAHA